MLSNSILYKILPSGNVYTFKVFFPALPERPENLQLAVNDDFQQFYSYEQEIQRFV